MRAKRFAKLMGASLFMGMGAMAMSIAYVTLYEKIMGESFNQD